MSYCVIQSAGLKEFKVGMKEVKVKTLAEKWLYLKMQFGASWLQNLNCIFNLNEWIKWLKSGKFLIKVQNYISCVLL